MDTYKEILEGLSKELKVDITRARIEQYTAEADVTCVYCRRELATALHVWSAEDGTRMICVDRAICGERVKGAEKVVAKSVILLPQD